MDLWELAAYLATGVASGVLAGLFGVGGGVVVVPALIFVFGRTGLASDWIPHLAVGTSLAAIVATVLILGGIDGLATLYGGGGQLAAATSQTARA